ncbi:hypothetical protein LTR56_007758 [Elasticomyces elasticus]|nr:hypothetical protein LTR56_007758 [Elasticomyces elasticus]KAK3661870.1 hypothetical protein LTR22_007244 [Elasticomyces elasticus]KAK4925617.1 hypothetical protein LTR49_007455 [Elasticomyces elasticus]KAK5748584.1 hypothetical protein LTS12_021358 [Elasticomyces elasticus]
MPGAGKQAPEVQARIRELLEAGFDPTTIHKKLKVGRSSIYRMKRCLEEHGTAYMPSELNKKNGRPKVLTAEQELEVRDWLRNPPNRTRYLDDLVWLIHDRFGTVCSTTTMSKLKRKWMRVIEAEETGHPLDASIREQVLETHPDLPILQAGPNDRVPMTEGELEEYRRLWRTTSTSRVRAPRNQVPAQDSPSSSALEGTAYPPPPPEHREDEDGGDGVMEERLLSLPEALRKQQVMAEHEQQVLERQRQQQVPWPELPNHRQQQHHGVEGMTTAQEQATDPRLQQLPLEPYYGVPAYGSGMQRELAS